MKLVTFVREDGAPQGGVPQIGALTSGSRTIAVLQVGAEVMGGAASPFFIDMLAFPGWLASRLPGARGRKTIISPSRSADGNIRPGQVLAP
jgi:hypothetical protein